MTSKRKPYKTYSNEFKLEAFNVILHSDQGSTNASCTYQQQLRENGLRCSMSKRGEIRF
jgi:transposase InsO family protein